MRLHHRRMHAQRRDREEEHTERDREREDCLSRRHGFEPEDERAPVSDDERRQVQSALYVSALKQEAKEQLERLQEQNARPADARPADARPADNAAPALIIGAATVRQIRHGGDVDPLQEHVGAPGDRQVRARDALAQALVAYRFTCKNAGDPKKLVTKDNQINKDRLIKEYDQIVRNGPASIRWAKEHGKLNLADGNRAGIEPATCSRSDRRLKRTFPGCSHPMGPHLRALLTSRV